MRTAEQIVMETIRNHRLILQGEHLVLGVSGGPDSLSLLHILYEARIQLKIRLTVVHVNHGFRPGEAEREAGFVRAFCARREIPCRIVRHNCAAIARQQKQSPEEAGREVRYDALFQTAKQEHADKVVVAQNRDDQAETVLFRILRGTGTDGLAGMAYCRKDDRGFPLIRPLLDTPREAVELYCTRHALQPCRDATNEIPQYARNRIRLELLPLLREQYNPGIDRALCRLAATAAEDRSYLQQQAEHAAMMLRPMQDGWRCSRDTLAALPAAVRHRVICLGFNRIGLYRDMERGHLQQADWILNREQASGCVDFPFGYRFRTAYREAIWQKPQRKETQYRLHIKTIPRADYVPRCGVIALDAEACREDHLDADQIQLRHRRPGDRMTLQPGRKKIQDLLVDMKVPAYLRDRIWLAAEGSRVLWIPPGLCRERVTCQYPVTPETKTVLLLEIEEYV